MLAPPKIYLWCFSRDMHDEVHCILQLIMQWVWSCTFCTPFKEAVSLQHIEHSSKHAAFFSEEVQFPFRKLFNYSAFVQSYSISFKTPDSYSRCSMWLTLSIAVKMCNGWRSLQHSLKRKIVVKGKCCLQVALCLEDKIVPWTRRTILATKFVNLPQDHFCVLVVGIFITGGRTVQTYLPTWQGRRSRHSLGFVLRWWWD